MENVLKGNKNCFELAGGSSYIGFLLLGVNCTVLLMLKSGQLIRFGNYVVIVMINAATWVLYLQFKDFKKSLFMHIGPYWLKDHCQTCLMWSKSSPKLDVTTSI